MKRQWFADDDGTFYRNCPLIKDEMDRALRHGRLLLHRKLTAEWHEVFRAGVARKPALERGDVLMKPAPFRKAYPRNPGLWRLDGGDWRQRMLSHMWTQADYDTYMADADSLDPHSETLAEAISSGLLRDLGIGVPRGEWPPA